MTIAATLRAVTTVRRPFGHRALALPTEREPRQDRSGRKWGGPLDSPSRQTLDVELLAQSYLRLLG